MDGRLGVNRILVDLKPFHDAAHTRDFAGGAIARSFALPVAISISSWDHDTVDGIHFRRAPWSRTSSARAWRLSWAKDRYLDNEEMLLAHIERGMLEAWRAN